MEAIFQVILLVVGLLFIVGTLKVTALVLALLFCPSRKHGITFSLVWGLSLITLVSYAYGWLPDIFALIAAIVCLSEFVLALVWCFLRPKQTHIKANNPYYIE